MDEVSALISQKLKAMSEAPNCGLNGTTKDMAITALFPYAVWKVQNGQCEMFGTLFCVVRAHWAPWFMLHHIEPLVPILLNGEGPVSKKQAVILASPHLPWGDFTNQHLVQPWAAAASEVPYTDEICQSVVNTLLQIASNDKLQPHIPVGMWQWLNKQPTLPSICAGRARGSAPDVVQVVHGLGDAEILKSYLLLIWSEWDCLYSVWGTTYDDGNCLQTQYKHNSQDLPEMCTSIWEAFSGVWMGHHQNDLLQKLDHILGQLDLGLDYLQQHKPGLSVDDVQLMKEQYGRLREVLLEIGQEDQQTKL